MFWPTFCPFHAQCLAKQSAIFVPVFHVGVSLTLATCGHIHTYIYCISSLRSKVWHHFWFRLVNACRHQNIHVWNGSEVGATRSLSALPANPRKHTFRMLAAHAQLGPRGQHSAQPLRRLCHILQQRHGVECVEHRSAQGRPLHLRDGQRNGRRQHLSIDHVACVVNVHVRGE